MQKNISNQQKKLITIENSELKNRIDELSYSNVKALSFALTFLFLIFSIGHIMFFKTSHLTTLQTIMSFLILFAFMNILFSFRIPARFSHMISTIILCVILFNSVQYIKLSDDLIYFIYIILLIIGCGIFYLSIKWYFIAVSIILATVIIELVIKDFAGYSKQLLIAMSLSFYFSLLANYLRVRSTRNFQTLLMLTQKHERELEKAMKKIESINAELKDFAYIISHDLKAPLRAINSLAGWLVKDYEDKFDEDGKAQLNLLQSRVKRMDALIDGVLEYSRIGRLSEEHSLLNLQDELPKIIDLLSPPSNFKIELSSHLPTIKLEKTRVKQVFQNLISNAIKYIDKPEGKIIINCEDAGEFWKFSVCDNGPGINKKDFETIFKIFRMLQTRDQNDSTGIGLTVVKKIVEMYGGTVWVESEIGIGTTFYFTLPKMKKDEGKNEKQ
jgi:signal transduction histidine kinase